MKKYCFYFISPSIKDGFARQFQGAFADDCKAISWALHIYNGGDIANIAVCNDGGGKAVAIYLRK